MKKFLCLILSLCMVLCLALPAAAVTPDDEIISTVRDYLKRSASVKYNQANYDLTEWTVSELSSAELEKAQKHLESSVSNALAPMIEIQPNIGKYLDEKAKYIQYTMQREDLTVTNFSVVFGTPKVTVFQGLATVTLFETVGMRYPGLEQNSAVSTEYVVDLVETESGWRISNVESDDLFDQTHDIDTFDLETAIKEYNASNGIEHPFVDVPEGSYYEKSVVWAYEQGITSGSTATTFSPNQSCTRAQAVTFLWRAAGSPTVAGATGFSDVAEDAYYADAVKWAVANGITQGTGGGKFSPNATCNRAQIVTFLYRAEGSPTVSGGSSFSDVDSGDYYSAAVRWAVQNNITEGTGNGKFSPNNNCTRAQIVTFLYRAYA